MSEQNNSPNYVVCQCQHCDEHIEFDANEFAEENSIVPCPHCGLETKIFIPVSPQLPKIMPAVATPIISRFEGFFDGTSDTKSESLNDKYSVPRVPTLTESEIRSIGKHTNDDRAVKIYQGGEQDVAMSLDNARRYVADPRFKLMNPETGVRFTPATLEEFIKAKQRQSRKSNVVILTKEQCETPQAKELIDLLIEIEKEGFETDAAIRRLNKWLEANVDSKIPAVGYLLEITREVLSFGKMTPENAAKMQNAIVRVLPLRIQATEINEEKFSERLPARKSVLKRIRKLGCNPPIGITRAESWALEAKLRSQPSERQIEYIHALGGKPPPDMTRWDASNLIQELLSSTKATEKQLQYIHDLGGNPSKGLSRADAETLIPQLLAKQRELFAKEQPPTPRQMMVLRFWNRMDFIQASKWDVEQWLTKFYDEDPRRRKAWELFKIEAGDDGSQHDPLFVPLGAGENYLKRVN